MKSKRWAIVAAALTAALGITACGGEDPTATPTSAPTSTPTPAAATATPGTTSPAPTPTRVATSRDMEEFFDNQTITIVVGFSPGGGYDTFARLFAAHAGKHMPGNPRFVVRNLPGAGGERALVEVMRDTNPDGRTMVVVHPRFFKRELLGVDVPHFDLATAILLGTPSAAETTAANYMKKARLDEYGVSHDWAGALELAAKRGTPLTDGGTAPGDSGGLSTSFIQALGAPAKMVFGYGGSAEIDAAFDRGELDMGGGAEEKALSLYPNWIENKEIVPLFRYGADPENDPGWVNYVTNSLGEEIPPHIFDIVETTEGQRAVFNLTETVNDVLSRVFTMAPGVPDDIVAQWRQTFRDTVLDPEFVAAAELLGRPVQYGSPESMIENLDAGRKALEDPELRELFALLAGAAD